MTLLDVPCTHHYFGVKHGKGPSYRAGANFKRKIRAAVRAGNVLLNADAIEEYYKENFDCQVECGSDECYVKEHDVNEKHDINEKHRDAHSLFKVYNHKDIQRPRKELTLKTFEGSRDFVHAVRNTGVKGVVEYRYFYCGCSSCTTHTDRCSQNQYADRWKKFSLLPRKKIDLSSDNSDWFKPVEIKDMPSNDEFMHYEEDLEDAVHCDEVENQEFLSVETENAEEEEDLNDDLDVIEENKTQHDESEDNEPECDVTRPEVQKELVEDRDVSAEENKTQRDVIEESDESEDSVVALYTVPYESSDFSSNEDSPPNFPTEIPLLLNEEDENMNFDWKGILSDLKTYCTFSALKQYISRTTLPEVHPIIKYHVEENDVVDSIAAKFFPRDGPKGYIPIETMGDGNCSYQALAHVLLSDEGRY